MLICFAFFLSNASLAPAAPVDETYQYDALNRLTSAGAATYQHDAAGNLVQTTAPATPNLFVTPGTASVSYAANSSTMVNLTANVSWTASSNQSWLMVSPSSGTTSATLTLTAISQNPGVSPRNATVTISGGALTAEIVLTQEASPPAGTLSLSPTTVTVLSNAASMYGFGVNATGAWDSYSDQSWLTLTSSQGVGNGSVLFSITENTTPALRTAHVIVTSGTESAVFTLHQQSATVVDDHGNNPETATPLPPHVSSVAGTLTEGDQDFFRVTAPGSGVLIVWTEGEINTYGYLYAEGGTLLAEDDSQGKRWNFRVSADVVAGEFVIRVNGGDGLGEGAYLLRTRFIPDSEPFQITRFDVDWGLVKIGYTNPDPGKTYYLQTSDNLVDWMDFYSSTGQGAEKYVEIGAPGGIPRQFFRVSTIPAPPAGFALIPAGSFEMGDANGVGDTTELPRHTVSLDAFYMAKYETTGELWTTVRDWAVAQGYSLSVANNGNESRGANHPVHSITWYDMVKWCNARSEMEGFAPCYTVAGVVYRSGVSDDVVCNFNANGYRLPTEAEWEKAARGGLSGKNFPLGDTIAHSQANYWVYSVDGITNFYSYDVSPTKYFHPDHAFGIYPLSSPVGTFPANGYGLFDVTGNMLEWCWDSQRTYASGPVANPIGPTGGSYRVYRGGSWGHTAFHARVAFRGFGAESSERYEAVGLRVARSLVP